MCGALVVIGGPKPGGAGGLRPGTWIGAWVSARRLLGRLRPPSAGFVHSATTWRAEWSATRSMSWRIGSSDGGSCGGASTGACCTMRSSTQSAVTGGGACTSGVSGAMSTLRECSRSASTASASSARPSA